MPNYKKEEKYTCLLLRHKPEVGHLIMDRAGYVTVKSVVKALNAKFPGFTESKLFEMAALSEKQRIEFNPERTRVRACQGHSVDIDLGLLHTRPPDRLYHGTAKEHVGEIFRIGLNRMNRQFVHLSTDKLTAKRVGSRHGDPIVLEIRADELYADGAFFYESANGVWLIEDVPPQFFHVLAD